MHVPEEIRAEAAALIDHHALGLWKPNDADRRAAVALFRFLETGLPLTGEQIRSALAHEEPAADMNERLRDLLQGPPGCSTTQRWPRAPTGGTPSTTYAFFWTRSRSPALTGR